LDSFPFFTISANCAFESISFPPGKQSA